MRKNPRSQSGLFNPRVLFAFALCSIGVLLAMLGFAGTLSSGTKNSAGANANTAVAASASAPLGPTTNLSNGITFDHAVWNDPVRMVGTSSPPTFKPWPATARFARTTGARHGR
jgi:hypothetical protein